MCVSKQKAAVGIRLSQVGSEIGIRDRCIHGEFVYMDNASRIDTSALWSGRIPLCSMRSVYSG